VLKTEMTSFKKKKKKLSLQRKGRLGVGEIGEPVSGGGRGSLES
jgi:hypothetical protein